MLHRIAFIIFLGAKCNNGSLYGIQKYYQSCGVDYKHPSGVRRFRQSGLDENFSA